MYWQKLMVLCYPIHEMSISYINIMCKICIGINRVQYFLHMSAGLPYRLLVYQKQGAPDQRSLGI
jgi:hypothetical protein